MSGAGRIAEYLRKYPDGMPGLNKMPAEPGASCPPDRADTTACGNRGMSCLNKWKPGSKKSLAAGGTDLQQPLYSPDFRNGIIVPPYSKKYGVIEPAGQKKVPPGKEVVKVQNFGGKLFLIRNIIKQQMTIFL